MSKPRLIGAVVVVAVLGVTVVVFTSQLTGTTPGSSSVIVFTAVRPDDENAPEIYAVNADGSRLRQLTSDRGPKTSIAWSPDGSRLAYAALPPEAVTHVAGERVDPDAPTKLTSIFSVRLDGTDRRLLCRSCSRTVFSSLASPDAFEPFFDPDVIVPDSLAWSPDGAFIAAPAPSNGLLLVDVADGTTTTIKTPEAVTATSWSPDGERVAMSHTWFSPYGGGGRLAPPSGTYLRLDRPARPGGIYLLDVQARTIDEVVSTPGIAHVYGWTADSETIAFTRIVGGGRYSDVAAYSVVEDRTWTILPGTRGSGNLGVAWSPSGERIGAVIAHGGQVRPATLSILSADGQERIDIETCGFEGAAELGYCAMPGLAWSPEGDAIAYRSALAGAQLTPVIVVQDANDEAQRLIRFPGLFPNYLGESCCLTWHAVLDPA